MAPKCPSVLDEMRPIKRSVDAIRRNFARLRNEKKSNVDEIRIPDGYEPCPDCGDKDDYTKDHPGFYCKTCGGRGYVDWVENILGPKPKHEHDIDSSGSTNISHVGNVCGSVVSAVGTGGGGAVGHHTHMHSIGSSYIDPAPVITEIRSGKGIKIEHTGHSHSCGSMGMAVSQSEPTISVDLELIKKELMPQIEEQITNEVNRRLAAELLRRGIK